MNEETPSREELQKRLREKINGKKNGLSAAQMKKDPKTTLLSMGVDNADILNQANSIVKNPERYLKNLKEELASTSK